MSVSVQQSGVVEMKCENCGASSTHDVVGLGRATCPVCGAFFLPASDGAEVGYLLVSEDLGKKHDEGKPRMDLLDPYAIEQLSKVLSFGSKKYSAWNWSEGISYSRLIGAALRHLFAFMRGQDLDEESGLPHLAHCMCCLMFLLGMTVRHPEKDDRGPKS